nr:ORF102 [Acipenserid herpesvirus 1]
MAFVYPKTIINFEHELEVLTKQVTNSNKIEIRCLGQTRYEIHEAVYDQLLGEFGVLIKDETAVGGRYTFLDVSEKHVICLLLCLYLRYLGHIDDQGRLLNYVILQTQWTLYQLEPLAHYYNLKWLLKMDTHHIDHNNQRVTGPMFKRGQELMLVGLDSKILMAVGLPPHNVALTVGNNGEVWYALCVPQPHHLQLWVKVDGSNRWTVVSEVVDLYNIHINQTVSYQMTLAGQTCLYILVNNRQLICYNLINYSWVKIEHSLFNNIRSFVMAETGDGSLPLTLVANGGSECVFGVTFSPSSSINHKRFIKKYKQLSYKCFCYNKIGYVNPEDTWPDQDPLIDVQERLDIIADNCPRRALVKRLRDELTPSLPSSSSSSSWNVTNELIKEQEELAFKRVKVDTLEEGLEVLSQSGRPTDVKEFMFEVTTEVTTDQDNQDPDKEWRRIVVVAKSIYGQRYNGEWWSCKVINKKVTEWAPIDVNSEINLGYDYATDALAEVKQVGSDLYVNQQHYFLNLHNPNFYDFGFLMVENERCNQSIPYSTNYEMTQKYHHKESGLEALVQAHVLKGPEDKLKFVYNSKREMPAALDLFLHSPDPTMILENKKDNLSYPNGGLRWLVDKHPVTDNSQVELYVCNPPSSHRVQTANLKAFVKSRFVDSFLPLEFVAFCSMHMINHKGTYYDFNTRQRVCFHFLKNSDVASEIEW